MIRSILIGLFVFLSGCALQDSKKSDSPAGYVSVERAAVRYVSKEARIVGESAEPNPAIVRLTALLGNTESCGTGFFVLYKEKEFLVTAKHLVIHSNTLSALYGETSVPFTVISHKFGDGDIAVFLVQRDVPGKSLVLAQKEVAEKIPENDLVSGVPETWVPINCVVYGYPSGQGFRASYGKITHRVNFTEGSCLISTAEGMGGMSGSPWVDRKTGKVLAIHSNSLGSGEGRRSGGVSIEEVYPLLDSLLKNSE